MSELSGLWKYQNNPASAKSAWIFRVLKVDTVWKKKGDLIPPFSALFNPLLIVVLCRWVHLRPQRHQVLAGERQGSQSHDQRSPRAQKPHAQPHAEDADPETCGAEEKMSETLVTLAWPHILPCWSNICIIRMCNTFLLLLIFSITKAGRGRGGGGGGYILESLCSCVCVFGEYPPNCSTFFFDQTCLLLFFFFSLFSLLFCVLCMQELCLFLFVCSLPFWKQHFHCCWCNYGTPGTFLFQLLLLQHFILLTMHA